jgi:hypothetical protein
MKIDAIRRMIGKSLAAPDILWQSGGSINRNEGSMRIKNSRAITALGTALLITPMVAFGVVEAPAGAVAAKPTHVLTCTGKLASKPSTYVLSCADANAGWTGMAWSGWNSSSATGHGILRQNNCTPNCVSGKFINYRATVTLSNVIATKKYGELFSKATFHYSVGGKAKTENFGLAD